MKKSFLTLVLSLFCGSVWAGGLTLSSPQLNPAKPLGIEQVFNGFGCSGKNLSPALKWQGAPSNTQSFALTVYDPDAPTGSGWWHWVIFNIPATVTELALNAGDAAAGLAPKGSMQSMTDFGKPGFGGACPPAGDKPHRYQFTIFALKADKLPLEATAPAAMVGFYLNQNTLEKTTLTVNYSR